MEVFFLLLGIWLLALLVLLHVNFVGQNKCLPTKLINDLQPEILEIRVVGLWSRLAQHLKLEMMNQVVTMQRDSPTPEDSGLSANLPTRKNSILSTTNLQAQSKAPRTNKGFGVVQERWKAFTARFFGRSDANNSTEVDLVSQIFREDHRALGEAFKKAPGEGIFRHKEKIETSWPLEADPNETRQKFDVTIAPRQISFVARVEEDRIVDAAASGAALLRDLTHDDALLIAIALDELEDLMQVTT